MTDATDTLKKRLLDDASKRPQILGACERLIEDEVGNKGGLSGMAIKAAYKVVCKVKPGIIRESMDNLLDDFVARLEPFWAAHRDATGANVGKFADALERRSGDVADALLGITDDRAKRTRHEGIRTAYNQMRPQAKKHVEEAVPNVGRTLSKYL